MKKGTPEDPKGLIAEAYRIDGITDAECRSTQRFRRPSPHLAC